MIAIALLIGLADLPLTARVVEAAGTKYALEDADFVVAGATDASWSPDGKQLVVRYFDPPNDALGRAPAGQKEVVAIWSVVTRKFDGGSAQFEGQHDLRFHWEGPSGNGVFEKDGGVFRLNTRGLTKLDVPNGAYFSTSEAQEGVLAWEIIKVGGRLESASHFIPAGARQGRKIDPPEAAIGWTYHPGEGFYGAFGSPDVKGATIPVMFDVKSMSWLTGVSKPTTRTPLFQIGTGECMFRNEGGPGVSTATGLWLAGDEKSRYPAALLAPKSLRGAAALGGEAAFYFEGENLFVRRVTKLSDAQLDLILEAEEQMQLLSEAKQVGTAMHIFASDNDDRFPPAKGWDDAVEPYVRNRKLTDGFIYSYRGPEEISKIENPSQEILGYKEGRFGRAVVYADGSARWERRKKP